MSLLLTLVLAAAAPNPGAGLLANPIVSKQREREELIATLKRNIFKVDRSIGETEKLIAKSRNAPYLPDLQFRLAELYVERSRYVYYLQAEQRPEGVKGAMISPETQLFKRKAIEIYDRILREFPDFHDGDKVQFYLAHEQRELGQFDEMLKTLGELIKKWPNSPLRVDCEQILGDYFFDKSDLNEAEHHYQAVLEQPPSPIHDLARYKLGWIRVNQSKYGDAVTYFEAAAASAPYPGIDPQKSLNVKREALLDLVYSYTEARPAKGALNYFEKLSESRATYALALDKLGNRYFIKQQYEFAIPALRRLLEIQPDPELDLERAEKIYDSLKAAKGKVSPKPDDIRYLVRAAVLEKTNPDRDEKQRRKTLAEVEEMARDLSTQMHVAAQKKDERTAYLDAAEAYKQYLSLFRPEAQVRTIMRNRADALFAAHEYVDSARQFEELAQYEQKDAAGYESAIYGALLSHYSALKPGEVENLDAFEVADARQALKLLGHAYLAKYPRSEHALEVQFNIARAHYDDGEFEKSGQLFADFALRHPDSKDAVAAGNLALDSYRQIAQFDQLKQIGNKFLASRLPQSFLVKVKDILGQTEAEAITVIATQGAVETGDVVQGLLKAAEQNKGNAVGEKALYGAFTAAREKRDYGQERELGARLVADYPKSQYLSDVLLTLGRHAAEAARFAEAASWFEQVGQKLGADFAAVDGWLSGAKLRLALQQTREGIKDLENAADIAGARRNEVLVQLAEAKLKAGDPSGARATAEQILKADRANAGAAAVLAQVIDASAKPAPDQLVPVLTAVTKGPNAATEDTAKGLWYLGDILYKQFKQLPADQIEQKVASLQQLEGIFTQAASIGAPEWAVASLWRLATAYQHLADVVDGTPTPAGLSPAEAAQFKAAVQKQVAPVRKQADNAFALCLSRASSLEVYSTAVVGCRNKTDTAQLPLPTPTALTSSANLEELQRKAEGALNAATLEALGLAYLESRQVGMAQLTLGRVTELEDSRASAHSALGWALLLSGDPMGAHAAYAKALEADPTFEKARANLAALRCRFGDRDGAKREISVLKEASLTGPDVDSEWKACR